MSFSPPVRSPLGGAHSSWSGAAGWQCKLHHTKLRKTPCVLPHTCPPSPAFPPFPAVTQPHCAPRVYTVQCILSLAVFSSSSLAFTLQRGKIPEFSWSAHWFFLPKTGFSPLPCQNSVLAQSRSSALLPSSNHRLRPPSIYSARRRISSAKTNTSRLHFTSTRARRKCARRSRPSRSWWRRARGSPRSPRRRLEAASAWAVVLGPAYAWRRRRPSRGRRRSRRSRARRRPSPSPARSSRGGITGTRSPSSRTSTPAAPPRSSSSTATSSSGRNPSPASGSRSTTAAPTALPRSRYGDPHPFLASTCSFLPDLFLVSANLGLSCAGGQDR